MEKKKAADTAFVLEMAVVL
jgi:hypothetical protein